MARSVISGQKARDKLEKEIRKRGLKEAKANEARLELDRRLSAQHQARVQELNQARRQAIAEHPTLAKLRPAIAANKGVGDSSTLGFVAPAVSALTAPVTAIREGVNPVEAFRLNQQELQAQQESARSFNPGATTAGEVGGFFSPAGAPAALARAGRSVQSLPRLARLTAKSAESGFLQRAAAQTVSNLAGSSTAIAGQELLRASDASLLERIEAAADSVFNPTNFALNAVVGGAQAKFRVRATQDAERAMKSFDRIGLPAPASTARAGTATGENISERLGVIGNLAGGFPIRSRYMNRVMDRLEAHRVAMKNSVVKVRSAISESDIGKRVGKAAERIEKQRAAAAKAAFDEEGATRIGSASQRAFSNGVADFLAKPIERGEKISPQLKNFVKSYSTLFKRATAKGETVDIQTLENLRQELAEMGKIANKNPELLKNIDRRLMNHMTGVINEIFKQKAPKVAQAQEAGKFLRGLLKQLPKPNVKLDPDEEVFQLLGSKNFQTQWKIRKQFMTPEELQVFRGRYLGMVVEKMGLLTKEGSLPSRRVLDKLMVSGGKDKKFAATRLRAILGDDVVRELRDRGNVGDEVLRSIGRRRGSETATRQTGALQLLAANNALVLGAGIISGGAPALKLAALGVLNTAGLYAFLNSLVNGRVRDSLNRLATGAAQPGPVLTSQFVAEQGGLSGLQNLLGGGGNQ